MLRGGWRWGDKQLELSWVGGMRRWKWDVCVLCVCQAWKPLVVPCQLFKEGIYKVPIIIATLADGMVGRVDWRLWWITHRAALLAKILRLLLAIFSFWPVACCWFGVCMWFCVYFERSVLCVLVCC